MGRYQALSGGAAPVVLPARLPVRQRLRLGLRLAARRLLLCALILSLGLSVHGLGVIAASPGISPFVDRGTDAIGAAMDRSLARAATPERIAGRLEALLAENPRNWIAIRAVEGVAAERGVAVPPDLAARIAAAWAEDDSLWAGATGCLACAWDPAQCRLSAELLCQAPMVVTPIGDVAGLAKEGVAYAVGQPVDELNLVLSAVGLGATVLVVASGGSSAAVKLGASSARLARRMGVMSPALAGTLSRAAREGVDWARLPAVRSADDVAGVLRPDRLAPVTALAADLGRVGARLGPGETLHLLRYVDDGAEARRLAAASEALGPATVGRMEVFGKARFFRATVRLSRLSVELFAGLFGLLLAAGQMLAQGASSALIRGMRRMARRV